MLDWPAATLRTLVRIVTTRQVERQNFAGLLCLGFDDFFYARLAELLSAAGYLTKVAKRKCLGADEAVVERCRGVGSVGPPTNLGGVLSTMPFLMHVFVESTEDAPLGEWR